MSKKTFKKVDIKNAAWDDYDDDAPLVLEHEGPWSAEGKYQYQECILRDTATGLFYSYNVGRSGSPFTDYDYTIDYEPDEIELVQVALVTKVIKVWAAVELGEVKC